MTPDRETFRTLASRGNLITLTRRLMSDQLTPVLAYRRLVRPDERTAPSFLFESVEGGSAVGRHSFLGAQPAMEVIARGHEVTIIDHRPGGRNGSPPVTATTTDPNPLSVPRRLTADWKPVTAIPTAGGTPADFTGGGWIGYAAYDAARYLEPEKLPFSSAPPDDRDLPDMHFCLYRQIAVFDHVEKVLYAIHHVLLDEHDSVDAAYDAGCAELAEFVDRLETHAVPLPAGSVSLDLARRPHDELESNFTRGDFEKAVERIKEYIAAGDAFQIVISQRFRRRTAADPFEIYRALRIVNPSPYMIYLQALGSILVASSPEILCRVQKGVVTSRPLAGTRKRGETPEEDLALEEELRADEKERAEHVMLVDLGRNDLGRVCDLASIKLDKIMNVERYSHVMHLSSTVTGRLSDDLDCWDALQQTLPVGTVSGAPKVRAMQIIDELEPTRRGPYAGGIGGVGFTGEMDIAIALRTMVIPTAMHKDNEWTVHLQAGAGIVADSIPAREYEETVNKAAALGRAIDLAETTFRTP
ncbi:MAG: anthranilate synthase component I [Phycisphaerales bacterium]|nr:MAG: anthranilate synthase component I [Phycisphaerales bacterium]